MKPISPSKLAAQAAGLSCSGMHAALTHGQCVMCGLEYSVGDKIVPFLPPKSFMDYSALRNQGGSHICGWCNTVWSKVFSQNYLKTVICSEGIFPASSNDHIAYWLLNPPEGQWLFLQSSQKVHHITFRTPINYSRDVYQIRMGENLVTIRRNMLIEGTQAAKELTEVANQIRYASGKRGTALKSPFVSLSRDFDALSHGALRHDLITKANEMPSLQTHVKTITRLTAGELWALTAVLYALNPHRPEVIPCLTTLEN